MYVMYNKNSIFHFYFPKMLESKRMGSALFNALSIVIKSLNLIEKDVGEVCLHFNVKSWKSQKNDIFNDFQDFT